jgi:peptidoglycan/xylan/chitin deacetylase (PgdA/CDA1 family)
LQSAQPPEVDKHATWLACGGIAAGIVGIGAGADRSLRTTPVLTVAGAVAGGVYLVGTFSQASSIFGSNARTRRVDGRFALTFDDGPDSRYTRRISEQLAERGHRATFFVLARAVTRHPEIAAQLVADGHEVANHGGDHRLLALSPPRAVREQIAANEQAVQTATGMLPAPLFRAPHGARSPWLAATARRLGYRICGWDGRVFDTARPGVDEIVERATKLLMPGAVVLLHDGDGSGLGAPRDQTVDALPAILDAASARGLRSVPLSALL